MTREPLAWGSVQYDPIVKIYDEYLELEKKKPSNIYTNLHSLGIHFRMVRLRTVDQAREILRADFTDFDPEDAPTVNFEEISTADGFFNFARDLAWDLWSAAPAIAYAFFDGLELDELENADPVEAPGWPIINQFIIGGESRLTAAACIILKAYGVINSEEAFHDFST